MNKKFYLSLLLICAAITLFPGCETGSVKIYIGNSEKAGTQLVQGENVHIAQTKESIKENNLFFSKNSNNEYDNLYFNFEGGNIKSVDVTSSNHSVLYEHIPDRYTYCVEEFPIAFYVSLDDFDTMYYSNLGVFTFSQDWNSGKYDDVRNVYFNGMSSEEIIEYNDSLNSDGTFINGFGSSDRETNISNYGDSNKIEPFERYVMVDGICEKVNFDTGVIIYTVSKSSDKPTDSVNLQIVNQDNTASSSDGDGTHSFLYRYELLFYKSQQKAMESKGSFNYSDLQGETIEITVKYTDKRIENYSVEITFDSNGNIIATLR